MNSARIVWTGPGRVQLQEVTVADPGPGQVTFKTDFSLVSPGTEREWLRDDVSHAVLGTTFPFTPGYSAAGRIVAVGEKVSGWAVGDPAVVLGPPIGAHAAHQVIDAARLLPVPEGVSREKAVYFQLGGTAVHTVRLANLHDGDSVGIVGQGPIGQIALQAVRALCPTSSVLALDLDPERLKAALAFGADTALDPRETGQLAQVLEKLGGGVRAAVDLSGAPNGMNTAVGITGPLGKVVLSTGVNTDLSLAYGEVFTKGLTLIGAFVGARPAQFAADVSVFLTHLAGGTISVDHMLSTTFRPEQAPEVYQRVLDADRSLLAPVFAWS